MQSPAVSHLTVKPGESAEVYFTIREEQLRFFNMEGKKVSETGTILISTGYADHLILTAAFSVIEPSGTHGGT